MMDTLHTLLGLISLRRHSTTENCSIPISHPQRDWLIISVMCGILLMTGCIFDVWLYLGLQDVETPVAEVQQPVAVSPGPSADRLNALLSAYQVLQTEHQQLIKSSPAIIDPAR